MKHFLAVKIAVAIMRSGSLPSHMLLTQLNFRGVSSRTAYKAKAGNAVDPKVTQHTHSGGLRSFSSDVNHCLLVGVVQSLRIQLFNR